MLRPLIDVDIGDVGAAGSSTSTHGVIEVTGSGFGESCFNVGVFLVQKLSCQQHVIYYWQIFGVQAILSTTSMGLQVEMHPLKYFLRASLETV